LAAAGQEEDEHGRLLKSKHYDKSKHSVSFWDGFHRLVNNNRLLLRLFGTSAPGFLMDAPYHGNTVCSPMVLSVLNSDHTLLQKTLTQIGFFAIFAAPGHAVAAFTVDRLGRKTMQTLGFGMMAATFLVLAFLPNLQKMAIPFLIIYGLSFFLPSSAPMPQLSSTHQRFFPCTSAPLGTASRPWRRFRISLSVAVERIDGCGIYSGHRQRARTYRDFGGSS
jgi:PHS family inorganic phosphate transporter-like MFS transporter